MESLVHLSSWMKELQTQQNATKVWFLVWSEWGGGFPGWLCPRPQDTRARWICYDDKKKLD